MVIILYPWSFILPAISGLALRERAKSLELMADIQSEGAGKINEEIARREEAGDTDQIKPLKALRLSFSLKSHSRRRG